MTNEASLHILLVEDNAGDARLLREELADVPRVRCELHVVETLAEAARSLEAGGFDAVLLDLSLPDAQGIEAVIRLRKASPVVPLVVLTGLDDDDVALRTVKQGAQDFLVKGHVNGPLLVRAIRYAIERKRADESEAREKAAAQLAVLRERFMAILGHDLRNPVASILLNAGTMLTKADLNERQAKAMTRIARSANRMDRMIRDLLDFARTHLGGGYDLSRARTSLEDICRQVVEELEVLHPGRSLVFTSMGALSGEWDHDRIAQVASNLIGNAAKYSPAGTPVMITLKEDGAYAILEVHNQGDPIPDDLLPSLFGAFQRARRNTGGDSTPGLGLGLYIANQIVLAHGGRIEAQSSAVAGTTFSVVLPRTAASRDSP